MHPDMINPKKYRQLFLDDFRCRKHEKHHAYPTFSKEMGSRYQRSGGSEPILPAMELGEESVGMVVLWTARILRVLGRRRALGKTFPRAIRIERFQGQQHRLRPWSTRDRDGRITLCEMKRIQIPDAATKDCSVPTTALLPCRQMDLIGPSLIRLPSPAKTSPSSHMTTSRTSFSPWSSWVRSGDVP